MNKNKPKFGSILQFATEDSEKASFNGTIYRKQVAKYGQWVNPDYPFWSDDPHMTLDDKWGETVVENFDNDALGSPVPVPLNHTDDVRANAGVVQSLESIAGDGLYAELKILDEDVAEDLDKGLIFDVSISFQWDYISQKDGTHFGATLLHVALVNTPYLVGMNNFEKVGEALSKLSKSFKPVGLSLGTEGAIMLSRTKVKELSSMDESNIKNDKDFDVTVKVTRDGEEVEEVVKAGEEVTVPTDQAETVGTQIADAVQEDEGGEGGDDDGAGDDDAEGGDEGGTDELSKVKLENAELKLSKAFDELLAEGKVVPAQKDQILGLAKLSGGQQLSVGDKKIDLAKVVLDILKSGTKQFSTEENGSGAEGDEGGEGDDGAGADDTAGKKPSETLSDAELAGMKAVGADPAKMDELAEKDPAFKAALENLSKKGTK